jgi:hypothetical protein
MSKLLLGTICGTIFGIIDVLMMIPLEFPTDKNKAIAMAGAFANCLSIGFVIGAARLPLASWLAGMIFGLLLSLPDAIITGAYVPILPVSAIGGLIIGYIVERFGK